MVDAEGRDGSKISPSCFGPQTESQSLVRIWREREREEEHIELLKLSRRLEKKNVKMGK